MIKGLKYIVDKKGQKTSVLAPKKVWENLNSNYRKTQRKLEILAGIENALEEIEEAKRTGTELQTLNDFLSKYQCSLINNFK